MQIEPNDPPYDCDRIGEPCLPQCGWGAGAGALMAGYILPPTLTCANLTYYDYATSAAGGARGRLAWLQRMVSCVCDSPYMQLPFGVCDASNKGTLLRAIRNASDGSSFWESCRNLGSH
jgi:hypothetical protein